MVKRRKQEEWEKICAAFRISGMNRKEFCQQNKICYATLCGKLNRPSKEKPAIKFLPITQTVQADSKKRLSIHFPNGVYMQTAIELEEIKRLIRGLLTCK
jgi:hypothetical protein